MKHIKTAAVILLLMVVTIPTSAQNIKTYNGPMSEPDWLTDLIDDEYTWNCKGSYSYYEDAQENRIIHGKFSMNYVWFNSVNITGSYTHGRRNGLWTMKIIGDDNVKVIKQYTFQYKNGVLNGPFSYKSDDRTITGTFSNGIMSGTYKDIYVCLGGGNITESGLLDSEGRPHGVWTAVRRGGEYAPYDETILYYHGCIVFSRKKDLSSGKITNDIQISPTIQTSSDILKIHDTIIDGSGFVNVGGVICSIVHRSRAWMSEHPLDKIYPNIKNWDVEFVRITSNSGQNLEPEFVGGVSALNKYIKNHLRYPQIAKDNDLTGEVIVSFFVEPDGTLTDIKVKRDIGGGCGAEAVRLVKSMPKWKPGKNQVERKPYTLIVPFFLK